MKLSWYRERYKGRYVDRLRGSETDRVTDIENLVQRVVYIQRCVGKYVYIEDRYIYIEEVI